jgi:hypothetical protein
MISENNNKVGRSSSALSLLEEAEELARSRNWTRDFALYIMFSKAMSVSDKVRAEGCMNVLEQEVRNSLADPLFWAEKENNQVR